LRLRFVFVAELINVWRRSLGVGGGASLQAAAKSMAMSW
jgi:hypothetical protein